ncbi:MAG: hypothetical protein UW50_C0001G0240 [Candidatus Wolfebacteria bacterium GW2011_GWA1_44_24]|uniref:HPr kinase n=1 Tax=Candidatus Wolfebacteria bacterium GW2011_GWB1_41_12 TaxID=1619006 RepID=A0A0G0WXM0_9BACT|nr:MAG: hypothetical protein UU38_C0001G0052 [Candidatus Wolfebacteria bacterium GW2011_GWB1_41_12]KKT56671.1 MAG: hypothetical protein UW50_C0001G0240 [Candidatus Wolfebacteria bacterium GW2011_GWA1_44_24]
MKSFYNIHNFLKVAVIEENNDLTPGYDHYLRDFKADEEYETVDYEVRKFSEFQLPESGLKITDEFIGFDSGVYFPREKFALTLNNNKICEYTAYANRATNLWLQVLLLKRGYSFLHGAGAEINGKGLIFPAFGGTGKTTLMSKLRKEKNFKFFGDDFVIIDKNAKMHSYPSDFSIYDYHVKFFPEIRNTSFGRYLTMRKIFWPYYEGKRAVNFAAKRFLAGEPILNGWHADYAKVPANFIVPSEQMGKQKDLFAGLFLSKYDGSEIKIEEMKLDELVGETAGILHLEFSGGLKYLYSLEALGLFDMLEFETTQKEILEKSFSKIKRYRILVPRNINLDDYCDKVTRFINEITA